MSPYITYRDTDKNNQLQYYVLQRAFPHYTGRIVTYPEESVFGIAPIPGYRLWIICDGTIRGSIIPSYKDTVREVTDVLFQMSAWFWAERIVLDEKKFKKWKIISNDSIPVK